MPVQSPDWDFCLLSVSLDNTHGSCTEKMSARMKAPRQPVLEADLTLAVAEPSLVMAGTGHGLRGGFTPRGHSS